jgi:hypothetical protein
MKRSGKTAGDDFADNRVPGKGQKRARKSLTDGTELDNQAGLVLVGFFAFWTILTQGGFFLLRGLTRGFFQGAGFFAFAAFKAVIRCSGHKLPIGVLRISI